MLTPDNLVNAGALPPQHKKSTMDLVPLDPWTTNFAPALDLLAGAGASHRPERTNMASTLHPSPSTLDSPPIKLQSEPFLADTITLLRSVRDHDFDSLARLCDDDFGIVDVDPSGNPRPIRNRAEWEDWFHGLFGTLTTMGAETDSEILDYHAIETPELGYSVLDFRQTLTVGEHCASFDCIATIIWKRTPAGWREARWHASVISSHVPAALSTVGSSPSEDERVES